MRANFTFLQSRGEIDVIVAIAGILLGVVISSMNLIHSNAYLLTMGPLLIIVCLLYLLFRRKLATPQPYLSANRSLTLVLSIVFWLLLAGSIYSLSIEALHRPLIYFILISISASIIALQILYAHKNSTTYLILFEILLVSLSLRASAFWVFPSLPGIDSWVHREIIEAYATGGGSLENIPPLAKYYLHFPIMHLNTAIMKIVSGVGYKAAMFLGTGLPLMMSTLFVFLIGRSLVNARLGLLAMLLLNLADFHLQSSIEIIAMSFGITLYTIIIYLFVRSRRYIEVSTTALTILLLLTLILTHTVSTFIMCYFILFCLIGINACRFLYGKQNIPERAAVTPTVLVMFVVGMLGYWMYVEVRGGTFFGIMARSLYYSLGIEASFMGRALEPGGLDPILNISGFLLLALFSTLGCLMWLSREHQSRTKIGLVTALIAMIALQFAFPLFRVATIQPTRWFHFNYVIMSIVAAAAIITVISHVGYRRLGSVILICIIGGISFLMITNSVSNMDSPVYAHEFNPRFVYTNSELTAAEKVVELYSGRIITDYRYGDAVIMTYLHRENVSSEMLNEKQMDSGAVIWRNVLSERPSEISIGGGYHQQMSPEDILLAQKLVEFHNLIYVNNDVKVFLKQPHRKIA